MVPEDREPDECLSVELQQYLTTCIDTYRATHPDEKMRESGLEWSMNYDWLMTCLSMRDTMGHHPAWQPTFANPCLYGFPVMVRDDAGIPRLDKHK